MKAKTKKQSVIIIAKQLSDILIAAGIELYAMPGMKSKGTRIIASGITLRAIANVNQNK